MPKNTVFGTPWPDWRGQIRLILLMVFIPPVWAPQVLAHGAMENPASRTTTCRFDADAMENPMCEQAWATEPQALYDWMEVNLASVAGAHQQQIPDGTLCGAGRDKYRAFNVPGEWPATALQPGSDGLYPVTFHATAPHAAQYFRFYLTREGFDPTQDTLSWGDLELVYDSQQIAVEALVASPHYTFGIPLPDREGRAILYLVWQRSDSPEAFYGCSDVLLGASSTPPAPTNPVTPVPPANDPVDSAPIVTNPPANNDDETPVAAPGLEGLAVSVDIYDDWGSGGCGEGTVVNQGTNSTVWEVNVDVAGSVTSYWDAEMMYSTHPHHDHEGSAMPHAWRVMGKSWNRTLAAGESTTFGFCFDRTLQAQAPPSDDPTMPIQEETPIVEADPDGHHHDHPGMEMDSDFTDLASFGLSHGSDHTGHDGLVGGRTAITTEALMAYNQLREFVGLAPATLEQVGTWAFANELTNNTQAWGNDELGVGLWYAMQGAKVGWMDDEVFDPQVVADITRTARLGSSQDVMAMVAEYGHPGFAAYLLENSFEDHFINTLKMEPHYAGWMHDRAHGWLSIEDVAIAHDVNHLTVLSHDQMQPFMNDTWDWPQWPALDVTHARVLEYFQSMVTLGDPLGDHLENLSSSPNPVQPPPSQTPDAGNDSSTGTGNTCAGEWDPNEAFTGIHFLALSAAFGSNPNDAHWDSAMDFDCDGFVGGSDFLFMSRHWTGGSETNPDDDQVDETPPMDNDEGHDHGDHGHGGGQFLSMVAATTDVHLMVDSATGLAYLHEQGGEAILISRSDDYWDGAVPLTRDDANLMAAARDGQGRLRVLDGGGVDVYAWILDESGLFIGEEGPSSTSIDEKESLFQMDIDGDGMIGGSMAPPADPGMPPMDEHDGHDHDGHDHMAPPPSSGDYVDITSWGTFHGSNHNSEHDELVGGRTAITTEAHEAYNNLRAFLGLPPVTMEEVGQWAFSEALTNNSQAWGNDEVGVGLWYAMQGAKVGWIRDEAYFPQLLADIQRTARLVTDPDEMRAQVMDMVREYGHSGYADYLEQYGIVETFINTLKMEPHYGGWMHGRTHGFRSLEGVAINHDVNHLTVLSWDQMQPFMNDTFDWPQWPALDVSDSGVIEYFQSMVSLGNPVGFNLESAPSSIAPPESEGPNEPTMPPMDNDEGHDHGDHGHGGGQFLSMVAATTDVHLMVDSATGLAYLHEQGGEAILISRSDDYWDGAVPLTRDDANLMAAARDGQGRLRVLDGGGVDVYAWILDESGLFIGEEGPSSTSIDEKESLFQMDIDGDGMIGGSMAPPADPGMPPMDEHDGHDHDGHDHMAPPPSSGDYVDITSWGTFHGSNHNSEHDELVGGRTAITTEAHEAYNNLRAFLGLPPVTMEEVGQWAFSEALTNNSQAWGNDEVGVGLWYAMQGAKVGWIRDEAYFPQLLADIQRTARLVTDPDEMRAQVMDMVREYGHSGYADYLEQYGIVETFINTLKMEPHYGGWMHGRTHGFRSLEGVAINHDVNHLTVLSWDQMQPFMNDTFDWPQWPALDVSDSGVIEYFQSMVSLGNPVGFNLENLSPPQAP